MRAPSASTFALLCWRDIRGGVELIADCSPHATDLVRRQLLALAAPADHDAELGVASDHRPPDRSAVRRIVDRGIAVRAEIDRVVAKASDGFDEVLLQLEPGMVRPDRDPHVRRGRFDGDRAPEQGHEPRDEIGQLGGRGRVDPGGASVGIRHVVVGRLSEEVERPAPE